MHTKYTNLDTIPAELRARRQWIVHRSKVPHTPAGARASSTNPATWTTFEDASAAQGFDGIGFVFTDDDAYVGIDLDACVSDGVTMPEAQELIDKLDSYWELSPSGSGVHVIVRGSWPESARNRTEGPWGGNLEVYSAERYFTVTGEGHGEIAARQAELDELAAQVGERIVAATDFDWDETPSEGTAFPGTDEELLAHARAGASGERFAALYDRGDLSGFDNQSDADWSLVHMLADLTGHHPARLHGLFCESALYRAPPEKAADYPERTVRKALASRAAEPEDFGPYGLPSVNPREEASERLPDDQLAALRAIFAGRKAAKPNHPLRVRFRRFDWNQSPPIPQWMWDGWLTERSIVPWSGRFSSAKSLLMDGLTAAVLRGEPCLGREVAHGPVLRIDAENDPHFDFFTRMRSMGVDADHDDQLFYVDREQAPQIGSLPWNRWLREFVAEFDPVLIIIDGSVSATSVNDPSDVEGVKQLYAAIREATGGYRAVTVLPHHERKPSQEHGRGSAADAATGTRYWHNLADIGYASQLKSSEVEDTDTGRCLVTTVKAEATKNIRSTETLSAKFIKITGELGPDRELLRTRFELSCDPKALELREAILEAGQPLPAKELADAVSMDARGGAFDDARRSALEAGVILQPGGPRTPYQAGDLDAKEPAI